MNQHGKTHVGTATAFRALVGGAMGTLGAMFWGLLLLVVMCCVAPLETLRIVWDFSPWAVLVAVVLVCRIAWELWSKR